MANRPSKKLMTVVDVSGLAELTDEETDALADAIYDDMVAKIVSPPAGPELDLDD